MNRNRATIVTITAAVALTAACVASATTSPTNAQVRGVVLFVGDSNVTKAGSALNVQLTSSGDRYIPVFASRSEFSIRNPVCPMSSGADEPSCDRTNGNYWSGRLPIVLAKVKPDAIVVELGINDAREVGTCTTPGYSCYGPKIDWLMRLLPAVPVIWTNLPCAMEASSFVAGCKVVNAQLALAPARWPHLSIADWAGAARFHTTYMDQSSAPHYTAAGYTAWANLVASALDAKLPA